MGRGTLEEVRYMLGDPRGGPGRVLGPLERSGTGRGTLWEVQDGLGTLVEVRDGSEDPQRGTGTGRKTLGEV